MFSSEKISDALYRIKDSFGVAMYLVLGKKEACLIDSGYGNKGLRAYVETITDLPVFVLITHGHIDHAFGCSEFERVYMNHLDIPMYQKQSDWEFRRSFIKNVFHQENPDLQRAVPVFRDLQNADEFDLGEMTLQAIHVPGHTKGSMVVLIRQERMLLLGDACGPGTIMLQEESGYVEELLHALLEIKNLEDQYDLILRNHGTCQSQKDLLDHVIEVCREILAGTDDRIEIPFEKIAFMDTDPTYKYYEAKRTKNGKRVDGLEGNLSYREDKVRKNV